jgi:hypothetical protein
MRIFSALPRDLDLEVIRDHLAGVSVSPMRTSPNTDSNLTPTFPYTQSSETVTIRDRWPGL